MSARRRSPLAAVLVALLLLASCGDGERAEPTTTTVAGEGDGEETTTTEADHEDENGSDGDVDGDDLLAAVERTREAGSATVSLDLEFEGGGLIPSQELSLDGTAAFDSSWGDVRIEQNGIADSVRLLFTDETAWVGGDGPDMRDALPDGVDWVELPADDLRASDAFNNPGNLAFLYLVGGASNIEEDGDTYRFDVDLEAAPAAAPVELREEVASTMSLTGDAEPEVTGELVLDDDGRAVRLRVEGIQPPTAEEAEQFGIDTDSTIRVVMVAELSDFDEPYEVTEPDGAVVPVAEAPAVARLLGV